MLSAHAPMRQLRVLGAFAPLVPECINTWLRCTRCWEPLAMQQDQALAVAQAQSITPAPELTPPAPVVAPDVTEPDFSFAEEDHDVIISQPPSFKSRPYLPGPLLGPAVEELMQRSHRERKASRQVENETVLGAFAPLVPECINTWLRCTRCWEPLAMQQDQALAVAQAQSITPAPELTPPAPVVAPDVTEPDFSFAEEDHDVIISQPPSFKSRPYLPGPLLGPAVEELMQRSHRERKASRQVENET
ncbi:UNVERIFIED_CONTAM: hypothetical protein FKN15_003992 [Acipenser sinensis]